MNFKIGTRVIGTHKFEGKSAIVGTLGTIIAEVDKGLYCIEYDKNIRGHNGGSPDINTGKNIYGKKFHCWNTWEKCFKIYDKNKRID